MPVLPGLQDEPRPAWDVMEKVVDHPNAYSKFPKFNHNPKTNKSTISLSHPTAAAPPSEATNTSTARYRFTPNPSDPFADGRTLGEARGVKKNPLSHETHFNVTEQNSEVPFSYVLCRKPVQRDERPSSHGNGKKSAGQKNIISTNTVMDPLDQHNSLRASNRYMNSRRWNGAEEITVYSPTEQHVPQLGKDARYRFSTSSNTLEGVMTKSNDNCEDRSDRVPRAPWALEGEK